MATRIGRSLERAYPSTRRRLTSKRSFTKNQKTIVYHGEITMRQTGEKILIAALHLFARNGYEAVSVSDIAAEVGITKGALYRHYKNKRAIFDSIVARMEELDKERAKEHELPEGGMDEMPGAYARTTKEKLLAFTRAQFRYWTEEDFPVCFRRMLTLEQYRGDEMSALFQQYLASGPLRYVTDLFTSWKLKDACTLAVELYAPMFLFYSIYDGMEDKALATRAFDRHLDAFSRHFPTD